MAALSSTARADWYGHRGETVAGSRSSRRSGVAGMLSLALIPALSIASMLAVWLGASAPVLSATASALQPSEVVPNTAAAAAESQARLASRPVAVPAARIPGPSASFQAPPASWSEPARKAAAWNAITRAPVMYRAEAPAASKLEAPIPAAPNAAAPTPSTESDNPAPRSDGQVQSTASDLTPGRDRAAAQPASVVAATPPSAGQPQPVAPAPSEQTGPVMPAAPSAQLTSNPSTPVQFAPGTATASREPTNEWVCRERQRSLSRDRIAPNSELGIVLGVTSQWPLVCERKVISPALPPAAARLGPITDEDVSKTDQLVAFLNTNAGQPGFEPAWYQALVGVAVRGDTALALTTLAVSQESRELAASVCRGLSGFAYSDANKGLGLTKVRVHALDGQVLVSRGSATETCAGTSTSGSPAGTSPTTAPATPQAVK